MDLNQPNDETTIFDLYTRAKQAANAGDKRASGLLINEILRLNFTHSGAWALLHTQYGGGKPFDDFRREFAEKYFPDQAHLLEKPVPTPSAPSEPPVLGDTDKLKIQPAPVPAAATCPYCGQARADGAPFCGGCGYRYPQTADPTAVPAPVAAVLPPAQPVRAEMPARFTLKRILSAFGLLMIILAGLMNWTSARSFFVFGSAAGDGIGLGVLGGQITTAAGLLGLILLIAIRKESSAYLSAAVIAFIAWLTAFILTSTNIIKALQAGNGAGVQSHLGAGPYLVMIGAVIVLLCIFIPSKKTD